MKICLLGFLLLPFFGQSQNILPDANTIIVKNVSFLQVCNALLDSGYTIESKDNELMTAVTTHRPYPKNWNATYSIHIRVKDSCAFISAFYNAPPGGGLVNDGRVKNRTDKNGLTKEKSMDGYPFLLVDRFAHKFAGPISYTKQ